MKKTVEEIKTEIEALRAMQPRVRKITAFGDNNHDAVFAQIEVLEKDLEDGDVYDRGEADPDDEDSEPEWTQHEVDAAIEAIEWRDNDGVESMSESWKPLLVN